MRMRTIADADHGRANNFNLLRMLAASAVLVSHAWPITLGRAVPEPLIAETGYSLGVAAVVVFFAISGYFITKSFDRRSFLGDFVLARICRIFPGLIVALCLTAFVVGPLFTTLPLARYLAEPGTWIYVPQNALLAHLQFGLPAVFDANPFSGVTNGSLWTLKYEVGCYAGVVAAGYLGLLRPRTFPLVLLMAAVAMVIVPGADMALSARIAVLCGAFALGSGAYLYRAHVPLGATLAAALVVAAIVARGTPVFPLCFAAALGYGALAFGFADIPPLRMYNRLGDVSYGIYIYAFPIGQATLLLVPGIGPWGLIATTFPVTLLLAVASWTWIENPVLVHRHRLAALFRPRGPRAATSG